MDIKSCEDPPDFVFLKCLRVVSMIVPIKPTLSPTLHVHLPLSLSSPLSVKELLVLVSDTLRRPAGPQPGGPTAPTPPCWLHRLRLHRAPLQLPRCGPWQAQSHHMSRSSQATLPLAPPPPWSARHSHSPKEAGQRSGNLEVVLPD